ncbi:DUF922 domain-containing protein [Parasedimentitalea maritima]|uniref:DUF922 domain-containing protein n=1 Tax=Parasedimentitalea maritima TaxID=2578117 RepID=A0A6A4RDT6_9RHOB|nr:DUF922 domain-containing protein [Zongyanglinia marina]KAE9625468.1 DUF922 domain-containing protein [Zongyanglinia marina]
MAIAVKTKIPKPSPKTFPVAGVDMSELETALDKKSSWGSYVAAPVITAKFDKSKKVTEITVALKPVITQPKWAEYGKSTKNRQAEWDRMLKALEKYLSSLHALTLEAVAKFSADVKEKELDKAGFNAVAKAAKAAFSKAVEDYASKTSNGSSVGVSLEYIDPDPATFKKTIPAPKSSTYSIGGKTIEAVFKALQKRAFWGRYRSNASYKASFQLDGHVDVFTLTSKPSIIMPKWKDYGKANSGQKDSWDAMWGKLNTHENNHHDIFKKCVAELEAAVTSRDIVKADIDKFWTDETKDWQDKQDAYDTKSGHGVKEGVVLDASDDP